MRVSIRKFGWSVLVSIMGLGYASVASAASCFVDYFDNFFLDYCAEEVELSYCTYWEDFTDVATGTYSSGGCTAQNSLGYCRREELAEPKEFHYYEGNSAGVTAAELEETCEFEAEGITSGVWNGPDSPPPPEEPDDGYPAAADPLDIEGLPDASVDAVPDLAMLNIFDAQSVGPVVTLFSGLDASVIRDIPFFNSNYRPLRMDTGTDANQDGAGVDPFIAVLAKNRKTKETWVQVRSALNGDKVRPNLRFFSENYVAIDVAVLDDTNGDGVSNDPSVAVLAEKTTSGRQAIILRSLVTGKKLGNWTVTQNNSDLLAIIGETVNGTAPNNARLAVLAVKNSGNNEGNSSVIQVRVADGSVISKKSIGDSSFEVLDMAVRRGGAGFGITSDPAMVVLGNKANGTSKVVIRDLKSHKKEGEVTFLSDAWSTNFAGVTPDINGNGEEDIVVIANKPSGDARARATDPESGESGTIDMDTFGDR